ncbi:MAG: hypothetical protein K8H90_07340 [Thermoanaerobaculia bacterium]|nr:hypothetical protein [Thermoanaerobaculia bacterium]
MVAIAAALATADPAAAVSYRTVFWQGNGVYGLSLWNIPGLSTFDVYFPAQRAVSEIRAMPAREWYGGWETLDVRFHDDAFTTATGTTSWAELQQSTFADSAVATSSSGCGETGSCRLPIYPQLEGEVFVLAGFRFEFYDQNHYISEIAIRPNPLSGYVDVTFTDASRSRPFGVAIAYAYYPAELVTRVGHTYRNAGSPSTYFAPGARKVLQGFRVAFDRGEHPLRRFAIDLSAGVRVRFHDTDGAETINWSVDWIELED